MSKCCRDNILIVIGICCWISEVRQLTELKRCLDSVNDFKVIVINGKWYDIKGPHPYSIPEARSLLLSYPNVTTINYANHHEWEARNKYLEMCKDTDVLIWLDTDEWFEMDFHWEVRGNIPSVALIEFFNRIGGTAYQRRVIINAGQCRHTDRHNQIWAGGKELFANPSPAIKGVRIYHDKQYRSIPREKAMQIRNKLKPYR